MTCVVSGCCMLSREHDESLAFDFVAVFDKLSTSFWRDRPLFLIVVARILHVSKQKLFLVASPSLVKQLKVIIFHRYGAAYLSFRVDRDELLFYVSVFFFEEKADEIKIGWDLQMLLPCCASVTSSFMRGEILKETRIKIMIHVGYKFPSPLSYFIPQKTIFHHFNSRVARCEDFRNSMFCSYENKQLRATS